MSKLPYVIECKPVSRPYFDSIAAFDCQQPAVMYMLDCSLANPKSTYRVLKNKKLISEISPTQTTVAQQIFKP